MEFVRFAGFSCENLPIWFAQIEAAFTLNGIISESDKYDYVINLIPTDTIKIVEDVVMSPPSDDKYATLKHEFIKRMILQKLQQVKFGHEKPSAYLNKLKKLAGLRVPPEAILEVWANNLPEKVRELVRIESSGNMDRLSELADKAMALVTPNSSEVPQVLSGYQLNAIMPRMHNLIQCVKMLPKMVDSDYEYGHQKQFVIQPPPGLQHSSIQQNFQENANMTANYPPYIICWYHYVSGDKAIACIAPCQYKIFPTQY